MIKHNLKTIPTRHIFISKYDRKSFIPLNSFKRLDFITIYNDSKYFKLIKKLVSKNIINGGIYSIFVSCKSYISYYDPKLTFHLITFIKQSKLL